MTIAQGWVDDPTEDIDGIKILKINCLMREWFKERHGLRYSKMYSSRRKGLIGAIKVGRSIGNLYCHYDECPFNLSADGKRNTLNLQNVDTHKICFGCGHIANRGWCGVWKSDRVLQGVRNSYHLPYSYAQVLTQTKYQQIQESG